MSEASSRGRDRRVDGTPSPRRVDTRSIAQVAEAERIQREADDQLRKLRNATDASLTQAKKKVDDQNKRLDDFRSERGARTHDQVIKKCVEDERRLARSVLEGD